MVNRLNLKLWLMMLVGLLLLGCGPAAAATPTETAGKTPEATQPALQPVTPAADAEAETPATGSLEETAGEPPAITFEQLGGLRGIGPGESVWEFYEDGRVVVSDGRSWDLPTADVDELVEEMLAADFMALDADYMPEDTCCDRITYVITLHAADETHTVTTLEDAEMPQNLADVLQMLNQKVAELAE